MASDMIGTEAYELMQQLFPLCRSLTGSGVRATFDVLEQHVPLQRTEIASGTQVVAHSDAAVTGLLVLLRSREHPEGFRYELLVTGISDGVKSYRVTASLSPSLYDNSESSPRQNRR